MFLLSNGRGFLNMLTKDLASATSGAAAATAILNARNVYNRLLESPENPQARLESRLFLQQQLAWTCQRPHDFPTEPTRLTHWMEQNTLKVGERYADYRSEEHTSELQSRGHLVC